MNNIDYITSPRCLMTKLEKQIEDAKKWVGITLTDKSNKYLKIDKTKTSDHHYLVFGRLSKNNKWLVVKPKNCWCEKPHFFKSFGVLQLSEFFHGENVFVVKVFYENTKKCFQKLTLKNFDEVKQVNKINDIDLLVKKKSSK